MVVRKELDSNMLRLNVPKFPKKATLVRALSAKALSPMLVTLSGIITLVRALSAKAPFSMVVTLFPIVTLVRSLLMKAAVPMVVTLLPWCCSFAEAAG